MSIDTLRRWERAGRVTFVRRGNQRLLPAGELGVLVTSHHVANKTISARNHLPGVVLSVERDGVVAKVELACGPYRVISLMSRDAADELGLEPGVAVAGLIKSTDVMIER